MKKKIIIILSAALLLGYLAYSRSLWFPEFERMASVKRAEVLFKPVDLEKPGKIQWRIPMDQWKYTGEVKVALLVDNIKGIPTNKDNMILRVVMDASAVTYEPSNSGMHEVLRANRLIRNWYYTTNEPFSPKARIWQTGGQGFLEYGLCGVNRDRWEDTIIEMEVLQPDPALSKAHPRLAIYDNFEDVGEVQAILVYLRIIRDVILCLLAGGIIILSFSAMKAKSTKASDADC